MRHSVLVIDPDAEYYSRRIRDAGMAVEVNAVKKTAEAADFLDRATVICGLSRVFNDRMLSLAPKLQWIQTLTTGTDTITSSACLPAPITVTNMRGIHGPQMSELAILQMLSLLRKHHQYLDNQRKHVWNQSGQPILAGRTAGILGVGEISYALASRLKAFELKVIGFSSSPDRAIPHFDRIEARERLVEVAPELDFLIVLMPLSPQTDRYINARLLRALRPDSYLINLARGGVVDEEALLLALREKWIAGAALDVFREEPLPESSPLWDAPNLLVTPHIGGLSTTYAQQSSPILLENLALFLEGKRGDALRNCVLYRP